MNKGGRDFQRFQKKSARFKIGGVFLAFRIQEFSLKIPKFRKLSITSKIIHKELNIKRTDFNFPITRKVQKHPPENNFQIPLKPNKSLKIFPV